ncbi:MAG: diadenylate cyclase CdaA [Desulfovibrio sp.]
MLEYIGLDISIREILDVGIVAFIYYYLIRLVQGTRAVAVIYGLLVVVLVYYLSSVLGLYTLNWLLTQFLGSIFIVVIILFQTDMRKALAQVGGSRWWRRKDFIAEDALDELIISIMGMARTRTGALLVIERGMPLGDIIESGVELDSKISREIIQTIFYMDTPLHDGAVVIRGDRIVAAACILPLTSSRKQPTVLGTRHRSALGISEESDALVIVVSEERGTVSMATGGRLTAGLDETRLRHVISKALEM